MSSLLNSGDCPKDQTYMMIFLIVALCVSDALTLKGKRHFSIVFDVCTSSNGPQWTSLQVLYTEIAAAAAAATAEN